MQPIFAIQLNNMRIIVRATASQKEEWQQKPLADAVETEFIDAENTNARSKITSAPV